jgi:hypothetical protein
VLTALYLALVVVVVVLFVLVSGSADDLTSYRPG